MLVRRERQEGFVVDLHFLVHCQSRYRSMFRELVDMQTLDALEGDCLVAQGCFLLLVYFLEELLLKLLWRLEDSEVCYHLRMMVLLILVLRFV